MRTRVTVATRLSHEDRKLLSSFIRGLKHSRPTYLANGCTFQYRGSTVTVRQVHP